MKDFDLRIEKKTELIPGVWEIVLAAPEPLPPIRCGQFVHVKVGGSYLLRRPFWIYKYSERTVTLIVAVVGGGTKQLCALPVGAHVQTILPIGNGFTLSDEHKKIVLLGGGVGCAPLCVVPVTYPNKEYHSYLGFATRDAVLFTKDFAAFGETVLCTDDGSAGKKGFATDVLRADIEALRPDVILTCGPTPMLKAVARLSAETKVPAYMSGETRMGCGVGACLVCACALRAKNGEIVHKRACVDGPVFDLEDVLL